MLLDNSWLKQANSKNYHHFFPRSYLKKNGWDYREANSIVNITLVGDYLNKRKIKANPPSKYIPQFQQSNESFDNTMKSHLINVDTFGVLDDDYEKFLKKRAKIIVAQLEKQLRVG